MGWLSFSSPPEGHWCYVCLGRFIPPSCTHHGIKASQVTYTPAMDICTSIVTSLGLWPHEIPAPVFCVKIAVAYDSGDFPISVTCVTDQLYKATQRDHTAVVFIHRWSLSMVGL